MNEQTDHDARFRGEQLAELRARDEQAEPLMRVAIAADRAEAEQMQQRLAQAGVSAVIHPAQIPASTEAPTTSPSAQELLVLASHAPQAAQLLAADPSGA